jgi:hypothetical protein
MWRHIGYCGRSLRRHVLVTICQRTRRDNPSSSICLSRDRSIASSKLRSPKSAILILSPDEASRNVFGETVQEKLVQQPLKPLSRMLLCDHEPSQPSTVLCFMSLLVSLLPTSGEFVSEFPSPRVILSFFPPPWPYRLGWVCQELKLPPASLSGSWGVLGPPTTSRW